MIIIMHENSHNVNHDLSNGNIDSNHGEERDEKTIVSDEVFYTLLRQQNLLLINNESTQEDDATT